MIHNDRFYKLEMLVLIILKQDDYTCDKIYSIIKKYSQDIIQVKAGIILTSLYYFEESHLISHYTYANQTYYHIENAGIVRLDTLKRGYQQITDILDEFLLFRGEEVETYE